MQMKYLSLALAAALATTLTACGGSDNKSNYNKDTLTPVTKPDVKPGDGGDVKPGDENKKPGDDKPEDENKKPGDENKKPEDENKKPPKGSDIKNNVGDAANPGNLTKDNVVVAQNYLRGEDSAFDKSNNADKRGNSTVLGFNQLNNTYMTNVVVSRVLQPGETDKYTTLYLGQTPKAAGELKWFTKKNDTPGVPVKHIKNRLTPPATNPNFYAEIFQDAAATPAGKTVVVNDVAGSLDNNLLSGSLPDTNMTEIAAANNLFASDSLVAVGDNAYKAGIVTIKSGGQSFNQNVLGTETNALKDSDFVVRGQEDQIWTLVNDRVNIIHDTGASNTSKDNETRIFGSLSHINDIPSDIWNGSKFVSNKYYGLWSDVELSDLGHVVNSQNAIANNLEVAIEKAKGAAGENKFNAYKNQSSVFDSFKNSYALTADRVNGRIKYLQNLRLRNRNAVPDPFDNVGWLEVDPTVTQYDLVLDADVPTPFYEDSIVSVQTNEDQRRALISKVLNPQKIHLNYAQYGRVSADIDDVSIGAIQQAISQKLPYNGLTGDDKYELVGGLTKSQQKDNTIVDFYYARGLQPTTVMPKTGKYQYVGHALTYGLDNSFHGGVENLDSNSLIDIVRSGTGNYVAAELDAADKSVKGKIYNVWTVANNDINLGATEDVLISFGGKLNDTTNSVIGEAYRPYVAKDTKATFKGAFFGPNAEEFAGNINPVEEGYGDVKWGAVFAAQRPEQKTTLSFENAVEKEQN